MWWCCLWCSLGDAVAVYERRAQKLDDEKRELVMKCSAAVADREQSFQEIKALQRSLTVAKERATALELEKERALRKFMPSLKGATPPAKATKRGEWDKG
jgi:hypothetical protein